MSKLSASQDPVTYLRQASTVRQRCHDVLALVKQGKGQYFSVHEGRLAKAVNLTIDVTRKSYPTLDIPYHSRWRHFSAGGIDRETKFRKLLGDAEKIEVGRASFELAIISVLLDAGAGKDWSYQEKSTSQTFTRSEGLAVASYYAFINGDFSSNPKRRLRADAAALATFNADALNQSFQVTEKNPLVGVEGRAHLIASLAEVIRRNPKFFPGKEPRLGHFFDYFVEQSSDGNLPATTILEGLLAAFSSIWPGRVSVRGENLGDVWPCALIETSDETNELIPFHKLSQWLSYSLMEPLEHFGITVSGISELTGLPEYRNGGLLLDTGVLTLKDPALLKQVHEPGSPLVVEWRALTVALLDKIGDAVRHELKLSEDRFPLAKVLQGGTWTAGREIAAQLRPGGPPPLQIISDGTVF